MDDTDIINCICGKKKDDGFMIQCEQCLEWQHGSCVHIKQNHIPTHYFCQNCKKGAKQYRKDKVTKPKKRKIKRAIYSSSEEEDDDDEEEEEENERKNKFIETNKNMTQDTEVEKLLHRVRKQWLQLQKAKETGEKADESIVKGFESFVTMSDDSLTPSIPKASARPLQRSLRGASFSSQKDPSVQKGIFADIHIPEERYLLEIVGKMVLKSEYKGSEADYHKMEIPARYVFFFRSLDLCVDARQYGNDGRFLRRSCRPNVEVKNVITPPSKKKHQEGEFIHMGIYTRKEVDRGEELTLGWGWQRNHLLAKKKQEFLKNKDATIEFDNKMRVYIQNMLPLLKMHYGDCACLDKDECFIEFLKEEIENNPPSLQPQPKKGKVSQPTITTTTTTFSPSSSTTTSSSHQQHISKKPKINSTNTDTPPNRDNHNTTDESNKQTPSSAVVASALSSSPASSPPPSKKDIQKDIKSSSNIIPPSPAGSVEDNDTGLLPSTRMPAKKRWLQSYQRQREPRPTTDSYPSDSSSSENNNIPLSAARKKLSLENYWNQRRN
ncbi:SET domain-containing protein [Backusella circina FSU 941]|nr:SET domain-containing protein [Backusella circina FSU 941]